jgi:cytosine/adenosine deaminase-related metal-dependent hydrolase
MIQIRPADPDELVAFLGHEPMHGTRALMGYVADVPIGAAGVSTVNGESWVWTKLKPEARIFKFALHRAALDILGALRDEGCKRVYAHVDMGKPRAAEWLRRLGFRVVGQQQGVLVAMWEPGCTSGNMPS